MKKLLLLFALPVLAVAQQPTGKVYDAQILRVSDGDTVVIAAPFLPDPLKPELAVRIYGVDTPEKGFRSKCVKERQQGEAASNFTNMLVKTSTQQQVIIYGWDKYGGRLLGDIILNGQSLRYNLIANGYAREYYGEAKKSWCAK